ncbi:MAG: ADP-ribosyl-[dinitrogen reductase] hydrolase, partial [Planctomycetes bacterium]|nr:ADP-ribosyl-[dinitrogen reductase] hydrolase [Planctomycetota bacterium]
MMRRGGTSMEDRIVGMVMGLAVGDALGAPLEFMSERQVQIKHGRVTEMIGGGWLSL